MPYLNETKAWGGWGNVDSDFLYILGARRIISKKFSTHKFHMVRDNFLNGSKKTSEIILSKVWPFLPLERNWWSLNPNLFLKMLL